MSSLFSSCHVKKLARFSESQFGRFSLRISLSDFVLETEETSGKSVKINLSNYFSCKLLQIVNFDG